MKENRLEMAPWAKLEQKQKIRADRRTERLRRGRLLVVLLVLGVIWTFYDHHEATVQRFASGALHKLLNQSTLANKLQTGALQHEQEVNQITQSKKNN